MAQRGAAGTRWAFVRRAFAAALAAVAGVGTAVPADLEAAWDAQLRGLLPQAHTLLEAGGPASPEHRFALAGVALELGDLDGAQAALEPLAGDAAHPDFPRAALLLGRLHLAAGRDGAARRALFASLERSAEGPYAAAAHLALIRLDLHAGAVDDAGVRLRLLAEMGPSPELEIAAVLLRGDGASGTVRPFPSPVALFAAARLSAGAAAPQLPPPGGAQEPGGAGPQAGAGLQPITLGGAGVTPSADGAHPIAPGGAGVAASVGGARPVISAGAGATPSAAGAHSTAPVGAGATASVGGAQRTASAGAGAAPSVGGARPIASVGSGAPSSAEVRPIASAGADATLSSGAPSVGGARPISSAGVGAPSSAGVRPIASAGADATPSGGAHSTAPAGAVAPSSTGGVRPTVPAGAGLRPVAPALGGASPTATGAPPAGDPPPTAPPALAAAPQAPSAASAAPQRGLQPASATAGAAAGAGAQFTLRLGSFRDAVNAQHMVTALTDAGFPARSRTFGHFHRVLVGAAATRQAAESLLSRLRTIGYDGDVIPYPPDAGGETPTLEAPF